MDYTQLQRYISQTSIEDLYINGQISFQVQEPIANVEEFKQDVIDYLNDNWGEDDVNFDYNSANFNVEVNGKNVFVSIADEVADSFSTRVDHLIHITDARNGNYATIDDLDDKCFDLVLGQMPEIRVLIPQGYPEGKFYNRVLNYLHAHCTRVFADAGLTPRLSFGSNYIRISI